MHSPTHPHLQLSANPAKAAEEMMALLGAVQDLYDKENALLEKTNTRGFQALQEHKMQLAHTYEQAITQMMARKEEMREKLGDTVKNKMKAMQERFTHTATLNKKLLDRMEKSAARLGETIRVATKEAVEKRTSAGYTSSGQNYQSKSRNMSVGINETA